LVALDGLFNELLASGRDWSTAMFSVAGALAEIDAACSAIGTRRVCGLVGCARPWGALRD
jgi:hypothetical protein